MILYLPTFPMNQVTTPLHCVGKEVFSLLQGTSQSLGPPAMQPVELGATWGRKPRRPGLNDPGAVQVSGVLTMLPQTVFCIGQMWNLGKSKPDLGSI